MKTTNAKPNDIKLANLFLIRKVIKNRRIVTRSDLVDETQISATTVRSLITEMLFEGEIECLGFNPSSGGRKALRYQFNKNFYHGAAFCIIGSKLLFLLVDIFGKILEKTWINIENDDLAKTIESFMQDLSHHIAFRSIGIGVPGIVENMSFWKSSLENGEFIKNDIGEVLFKKFNLPIVLENDLNATVIGIVKKLEKDTDHSKLNLAYVHFEKGCISCGFIVDGKILHGYNNFAGELSLIKNENDYILNNDIMTLDNDDKYVLSIVKILRWISGILNPKQIVLGGEYFKRDLLDKICGVYQRDMIKSMLAEIIYSENIEESYAEGIAFLTSDRMFDNVQLTKE